VRCARSPLRAGAGAAPAFRRRKARRASPRSRRSASRRQGVLPRVVEHPGDQKLAEPLFDPCCELSVRDDRRVGDERDTIGSVPGGIEDGERHVVFLVMRSRVREARRARARSPARSTLGSGPVRRRRRGGRRRPRCPGAGRGRRRTLGAERLSERAIAENPTAPRSV
jgi:hypothetical protein